MFFIAVNSNTKLKKNLLDVQMKKPYDVSFSHKQNRV